MHKNKKKEKIAFLIMAVVLTVLVVMTNIKTSKFSKLENFAQKLVMPIQNGLVYLKNKIAGNNAFFENINNLKAENKELKAKIDELNKDISELGIIKAENKTLREYANLSDEYTKYETVPAYIIDRDLSNLSNTIVINAGEKDGIKVNMPVVSTQGVVGHIISVTNNTAKVQPIIDPSSSVSAIMNISRDNIIVKGQLGSNNLLTATYIGTEADLVLNDDVETSGLGGIYPKGLKIGTLVEINDAKNVTEESAIIETVVDFSKLETVLVIINK